MEKAALASSTPREWAASEGPGQKGNGWCDGKKSVQTIKKSAVTGDYTTGIFNRKITLQS
jgi:hypothetical protein